MSVDPTIGSPTGRFAQATGFPHVSVLDAVVLSCNYCGCLYVPSDDGTAYYPDRFVISNDFGEGCREDCECHLIPGVIS